MNKHTHRPLSIWITEILLVLTLINGLVLLAFMLFSCFSSESLQCSKPSIIKTVLFYLLMLVIIFVTFRGLQQRKRYGKWLAVSFLIVTMALTLAKSHYMQLIYRSMIELQSLPAPPYECWQSELGSSIEYSCGYESDRGLILGLISGILPALIPGCLAVRLVSSPSVKRFFH